MVRKGPVYPSEWAPIYGCLCFGIGTLSIKTCKKFMQMSLMDGREVIASNHHMATMAVKGLIC